MPTLPEDVVAKVAQSFGAEAELYDRARPPYPTALIERIVAEAPGPRVLDVGCGTGIASRQLRDAGCTVLGVEPDERMAAFARRYGLDVEIGTFEKWDPAGREFDAVVAAQSWHWVDAAAGSLQAARVLPSGGLFAAFWHVFALPTEIAVPFGAAFERVAPGTPFHFAPTPEQMHEAYRGTFDHAAARLRETGEFAEPSQWSVGWECTYTTAEHLDYLRTAGPMSQLTPDQVTVVLDEVGAAIDALGGQFTMPYTTGAVSAVRR